MGIKITETELKTTLKYLKINHFGEFKKNINMYIKF